MPLVGRAKALNSCWASGLRARRRERAKSSTLIGACNLPPPALQAGMNSDNLLDIRKRILEMETHLQLTLGHLKALEAGLRLSIATHTDPNSLLAALDVFEESLTFGDHERSAIPPTDYNNALRDGLQAVRKQVQDAQSKKR